MATNSDDTDLRPPDADDLDPDSDFDRLRAPGASPPRFGRLALCVAAAGALSFGVIGTVAYSVWFNHDQQAYAEAIASARRALGSSEPAGARGIAQTAARPMASMAAPSAAATQLARDDDSVATGGAPSMRSRAGQSVANDARQPDTTAWTTPAQPGASAIPDGPDPAAASIRPATTAETTDEPNNSGHAIWSGQIQPGAPGANPSTTLADASPAAPLAMSTDGSGDPSVNASATASPNATPDLYGGSQSPASARREANAANAANSPAQQRASNRNAKNGKLAQQDRRAAPSNAKHKSSLFARVGQFFRRVSYRQHGSGRQQQQDIYSHP